MNCETILSVGSRNFSLHFYVLKIFLAWRELNLKVSVQYVSRNSEIIQFADTETKNFDLHDYSLDEASFDLFNWIALQPRKIRNAICTFLDLLMRKLMVGISLHRNYHNVIYLFFLQYI